MCNWCKKNATLIPMVSGAEMPMICSECGTRVGSYDWKKMRDTLQKYKKRINILEKALERKTNGEKDNSSYKTRV